MVENLTNIKDRILQVAEHKGFSKVNFFKEINQSYANYKGVSKKSSPSADVLVTISTKFPEINIEWLLTGKGNMIKEEISNSNNDEADVYKLRTDRLLKTQNIPLYNIEAAAGIVGLFNSHTDKVTPVDFISIPNLPKCDGALYVSGDSMYPLLKSGDIVMYKEVHDIANNIFWGEMYLVSIDVDGEEYVSVKWIQKSELGDDYIKLVSQNQNHQPKDIPIKKIRALAFVKASIRINSMI